MANHCFHAVKGIQAGKEYFAVMIPLGKIKEFFAGEELVIPPEQRAQRKLNKNRVPVISNYILDNKESYVFSSLAASISGEFFFRPFPGQTDIGVLEICDTAKLLINDGQHRKAAIINAVEKEPVLCDETISVVLYADQGLAHSQQMFTDLNKNAVKSSNSLSELYDSRNRYAVVSKKVVEAVPFFKKYVDKERDQLGKYAACIFTLNNIVEANKTVIGVKIKDGVTDYLIQYWTEISHYMPEWKKLEKGEITKVSLRTEYISSQNVVLQALARIGNVFYMNNRTDFELLAALGEIDWRRNASIWFMRAVNQKQKIIFNRRAHLLIGNVIKRKIGLPLDAIEQGAEAEMGMYREE